MACPQTPADTFRFALPAEGQLSLAGGVEVRIKVPQAFSKKGAELVSVTLDGEDVTGLFDKFQGQVPTPPGEHELVATLDINGLAAETTRHFETILVTADGECGALTDAQCYALNAHVAEVCEIFNNVECLLPYPSSQLLQPAATPTGVRPNPRRSGCPRSSGRPYPRARSTTRSTASARRSRS
ncbi:MAG: hypothetical protein JRH10_15660 [Deltaproteobacteria bacterium]|nr:hypothetical protein [Deltaproteobacteria bacterium]